MLILLLNSCSLSNIYDNDLFINNIILTYKILKYSRFVNIFKRLDINTSSPV